MRQPWLTSLWHSIWQPLAIGCLCYLLLCPAGAAIADELPLYQHRRSPSADGIGKVYLGREIAQVMGHQGAAWLERPSRLQEENPQALVQALDLQPTDVVADIGAGTGYMSFRLADRVPQGHVLAVDVQPEMLDILNVLKQEYQMKNVEPRLGSPTNPHLAQHSIDWAIMVDAYHEFEFPYEMMTAIAQALKPNGHVALVEYRGENPLIPIKRLHKLTQRQARKEMAAVGLTWLETKHVLPQQHIMVFGKSSH